MPKAPQGRKPLKSKKPPKAPVSRTAAVRRQATEQEIGDTADKITRAPKKKR